VQASPLLPGQYSASIDTGGSRDSGSEVEISTMVNRRIFLEIGAVGLALAAIRWSTVGPSTAETFQVSYSDGERQKRLTPNQYAVLRQAATETPFTSPLLHEERRGNFACAGCDLDLFS
jgi:peptide-methionine (R)-S-oxide reductase